MPPEHSSRMVSRYAPPSQNSPSPANSGRAVTRVKQEAQGDGDGPVAQSSSPTIQVPTSDPNDDQAVPTLPAPVNQHCLTEYSWNGAYSDLEVISNGVIRSVHRIIVCSESPVLKAMCSNLAHGQPLVLHQYDPAALDCVLDFCYRRTYSDGEFPEAVAPFLTRMTAADVPDALEAPILVVSEMADSDWVAEQTECDDSEDAEEEQAEYVPYGCDIHCSLEYDSGSSDDGMLSVDIPPQPRDWERDPWPPYAISLFVNLDVYIAAKELQIPALQLVARERFAHSLRAHWARFWDVPALIKQVFVRTDESDPLRALICQLVAAGYDRECGTAFKAEIRELMSSNGEFATGVVDAILRLSRVWADTE